MQGYVTRIAPSPTGDMHLGTARTAYFNYLAAKASGGLFILRIDDTDVERNKEECTKVILDTMEWLGLEPDNIHYQSKRGNVYKPYMLALEKAGMTRVLDSGAVVISQKALDGVVEWADAIAGAIPVTDTNKRQMDGTAGMLVLERGGDKVGQITYQAASVFDDYDMGINYIIRGVDHITNTAKQVVIWKALTEAHPFPKAAHLGLITMNGKKMSKRDGAASMMAYRKAGYSPDAMLNFMLRMGWGPKVDNKENSIIPREKAIEMFLTEGSMKASPAGFDQNKLDWYNKKYKK